MNSLTAIRNINAARNINKDGTPKIKQTFLGDTATPACGTTTKGHSSTQGGLRGHSIGAAYPYSVVLRIEDGKTVYDVVDLLAGGAPLATYTNGAQADARATELGVSRRLARGGK